jgi:HD-like signal output (HDOD) protein
MERTQILKHILAEAMKGDLHFPTSTMAAMRVRNALDRPDCTLDEVARLAKADPLMAARVVALANSVVFNPSGREITDVRAAISRLGFKAMRAVAAAVATRQLVGTPKDPVIRACVTKLWEHTVHVAALAHVIARRVTKQEPETAMFAGIVHEVAGFYLLSRAEAYPGLLDSELTDWLQDDNSEIEGEPQARDGTEVELGRVVLKALSVPRPIVEGIESMWKGYLALPPTTLGDTLLLADQLTPVHSPLHEPATSEQSAAANLDMIVDEDTLTGILKESAEQANSLISALRF